MLKDKTAIADNRYTVLSSRLVELQIAYKGQLVKALIDRDDYDRVKKHRWVCVAYKKFGIIVAKKGKNTGAGQSLQSFLFGGKPRRFVKIPEDKAGRLDFRKKSLLAFAYDNQYSKVDKNTVELRIYHNEKPVRALIDQQDQQRVSAQRWHCQNNNGRLAIVNSRSASLHNFILGEHNSRIDVIPRDEQNRMDFRRKSLLPEKCHFSNTYRILSKKEMVLRIEKKDVAVLVRFDREDYQRVKTYTWTVIINAAGNQEILCKQPPIALTRVILDDTSSLIKYIPVMPSGMLDYRKAGLLNLVCTYSNDYRVLNENEMELLISKADRQFRVVFDKEDYDRIKKRHWRPKNSGNRDTITCRKTGIALTTLIIENQSRCILKIPMDSQGRLDFRRASLLSACTQFVHTYRFLNEKEVELHLSNKELEFKIIFDREDYRRVKRRNWYGKYNKTGTAIFNSHRKGARLNLTRVIFRDCKVDVRAIPKDDQGRFDYRKASQLPKRNRVR